MLRISVALLHANCHEEVTETKQTNKQTKSVGKYGTVRTVSCFLPSLGRHVHLELPSAFQSLLKSVSKCLVW